MDRRSYYRLAQQFTLMGFRGTVTIAKFLLAIYTARYLGLADLGIYGLVVGASTIVPAFLGFGVTDLVGRRIANLRLTDAMPLMTTRLALTVAAHLIVQPLAFLLNAVLGAPIPWPLMFMIGAILALDHLGYDALDMLVLRGRVQLSAVLMFIRAGLWPPIIIAWGLFDPAARTIDNVFLGWLCALLAQWGILALYLLPNRRWRLLTLRPALLMEAVRSSVPFYIKDISNVANLFLDRFLVSIFLGLELTGVYTFFWSVANVVHTLVLGVLQTHITPLIQAARDPDANLFAQRGRRLQVEILAWSVLLGAAAVVALPWLLPLLERPLLQANLPVFWVIMAGTLLRIWADGYGVFLLALHRDRAIAIISVVGAIGSVAMNFLLVPTVGLYGAAFTLVLTSATLLIARVWVSRSRAASPRPRAAAL